MYKAITSAVLFIIMAVLIRVPFIQSIDANILQAVEGVRQPFLNQVFKVVTDIGSSSVMLPLILVLTLVLAVYKKAAATLYVYLLFIVERMANEGFKDWISRERPAFHPLVHETSYSFPSGHSMNAAAMYPFIVYVLIMHVPFLKGIRRLLRCWPGF